MCGCDLLHECERLRDQTVAFFLPRCHDAFPQPMAIFNEGVCARQSNCGNVVDKRTANLATQQRCR
jgi:hypothetical protein